MKTVGAGGLGMAACCVFAERMVYADINAKEAGGRGGGGMYVIIRFRRVQGFWEVRTMSVAEREHIATIFKSLSVLEQAELIQELSTKLKESLAAEQRRPQRSPWAGMCADLGPAPSAEDIDEVRREVWKNFPREDI